MSAYEQDVINRLRSAILLLLDHVDYTAGNCRVNERVGATLPKLVIDMVKDTLKETAQ